MSDIMHNQDAIIIRYRAREIRHHDIECIKAIIKDNYRLGRTKISRILCEHWNWRQPNGRLKEYPCRDLLLRLNERGYIELPPSRSTTSAHRRKVLEPPEAKGIDAHDVLIVEADLHTGAVQLVEKHERQAWRWYVQEYHYLGDRAIVGEHLLYWAYVDGHKVGCVGFASAAMNSPHRESYVGWDKHTKNKNLHFVVNNTRFLLFPWVQVPNLASRILSCNLKRLSRDWEERYHHPVYLAETFVDTARFHGTCYKASNWVYIGHTRGKSKRGNRYSTHNQPKAVYVYQLTRHALEYLRLL